MSKIWERLYNGIIKENPTLIMTLGMCPTLAVTTSLINGIGMGLSTTAVLICSNFIISLLRKFIPDMVRIPAYIVIVASLVTIIQFVLQGFVPSLYSSLGIYIPLIVVNCIILGRAEAYAGKNKVIPSIFDGIGMGIGFTMALAILGFLRELIGNGTILSNGSSELVKIPEEIYTPASIIILAPGAFIVLAFVIAAMNKIKEKHGMGPAEVPDYTTKEGCAGCAAASMCAGASPVKEAPADSLQAKAESAAKVEAPKPTIPKAESAEKVEAAKPATESPEKTETPKAEDAAEAKASTTETPQQNDSGKETKE